MTSHLSIIDRSASSTTIQLLTAVQEGLPTSGPMLEAITSSMQVTQQALAQTEKELQREEIVVAARVGVRQRELIQILEKQKNAQVAAEKAGQVRESSLTTLKARSDALLARVQMAKDRALKLQENLQAFHQEYEGHYHSGAQGFFGWGVHWLAQQSRSSTPAQ